MGFPNKKPLAEYISGPLKIALIYLFFGLAWIMLSDSLMMALTKSKQVMGVISMAKGYFYVLLTAIFAYILVKSDRKKLHESNQKLENYTRLYATLSQINQLIVRTQDKSELFQQICKIAIDYGKFRMAWVGLYDSASGKIVPIVSSGKDDGYTKSLAIDINNNAVNKGPTGKAFKNGAINICNDIAKDPRMQQWREEALKRGYASSASIPIREENKIIGTLNLYAPVPNFFGKEERLLLEEIGLDVSFELDILVNAQQKKEKEKLLERSEKNYRGLFEAVSDAIYVLNEKQEFLDVNTAALRLYGYTKDELLYKTPAFVSADNMNDLPAAAAALTNAFNGIEQTIEFWGKRKDGSAFLKQIRLSKGDYFGEHVVIAIARDITKLKEQEKNAQQSVARLNSQRELITKLALDPYIADGDVWKAAHLVCESGLRLFDASGLNICFYRRDGFEAKSIACVKKEAEDKNIIHESYEQINDDVFSFLKDALYLDIPDTTAPNKLPEQLQKQIRANNVSSILIASIKNADQSFGILRIERTGGTHHWDHNEIELACQLAAHLGAIIERYYRHHAEQALLQTQQKYQEVFNATADAIIICDAATAAILDCNQSTALMFGYSVEELKNLRIVDLSVYNDYESLTRQLFEFRQQLDRNVTGFEWLAHRKDGSSFWTEIKLNHTAIHGENSILAVIRDIDVRKRSEISLMDSESRLTAMVSTIDEIVFEFDEEGTYLNIWVINEDLLAKPKPEMIGKKLKDIVENKTADLFLENIKNVLTTNTSNIIEYEIDVQAGRMWFWGRFTPIPSKTGKRTVSFIARDITERKLSEQRLIESERLLRKTQEVASLGHFIYSFATNTWKSSAVFDAICGISEPFERDAYAWKNLFFEHDQAWMSEQFINTVLLNKQVLDLEFQIRKYDSTEVCWLHGFCEPVFSDDGQLISIVGTVQDITARKNAEEAIIENEEKFRTLVENIPGLVYRCQASKPWKVLYISGSTESLIGNSPNAYLGENGLPLESIIHADDVERVNNIANEAIRENRVFEIEYRIAHPLGEFKWVFERGRAIYDKHGNPEYIDGVIVDITQRKLTDKALRESEIRFRELTDLLPQTIFEADANGKLTYVNRIAFQTFGYTEQELQRGINLLGVIAEKDRAKAYENIEKVFKGSILGLQEYTGLRKDGTTFPMVVQSIPIVLAGDLKGIRGIVIDISERKLAELLLKEREETLRTLIDSMPDIVCFKDPMGRWIEANDFDIKLFGLEGVDYKGKKDSELAEYSPFYYDAFNTCEDSDEKAWRQMVPSRCDETIPRPDGSFKIFDIIKVPMFHPDGSRKGLIVVGRDITERKQIEEELVLAKDKAEEMSKLKSNFLANMSHELRTPLIGILGFSEILTEFLKEAEMHKMAATIHAAGERLLITLNMLLNLAKIEANKQELKIVTVDITETVARNVKLFTVTAQNRNLALSFNYSEKHLLVRGDILLLDSILNNLISNAIKYTDAGSIVVTLDTIEENNRKMVRISVRDTGIGIPLDQQELIFDAFRQASEGYGRAFEGTGLGLTLTKRYVTMLGGYLTLLSEPGQGSTFTALLPLFVQEEHETTVAEQIQEAVMVPGFGKKILVIDDDVNVLSLMKLILTDNSKLHLASNSKTALELLERNEYGLVFLDINLREAESGLDVLKQLRKMEHHKKTPVCALTAYAMEGDREHFISMGCNYYLSKPFKNKQITELLSKVQ